MVDPSGTRCHGSFSTISAVVIMRSSTIRPMVDGAKPAILAYACTTGESRADVHGSSRDTRSMLAAASARPARRTSVSVSSSAPCRTVARSVGTKTSVSSATSQVQGLTSATVEPSSGGASSERKFTSVSAWA